ncbi:MAG TPA: hypothetical protein VIN34_11105 [Candidatus Limnocylindria bacterium]|jgi:hypothetical protein
MSYRTVAILSAVVSVIYGLAALVAPAALASIFGVTFDEIARYEARLLGGAYLGYGIVNYLTKDTADGRTQRAVAAGNAFGWVVSLVLSTIGQLQGLSNELGWTTIALQLVFTVLWGWTYVIAGERDPGTQRASVR